MPHQRPSCESAVDAQDLEDRNNSTLLHKSGTPSSSRHRNKPPSVHSDSGYSSKTSKTGLTSNSSSFNGRPAHHLARAETVPERHPHATYPCAADQPVRVKSAAGSAYSSAPPSDVAFVQPSAPPGTAAAAELRHVLYRQPSTKRPSPAVQVPSYQYPPSAPAYQPPPYMMPPQQNPVSYAQPAFQAPPSAFPQQPAPRRRSSTSRPRPASIHTEAPPSNYNAYPGPTTPSSGYYAASPSPNTPATPQTPGYWVFDPPAPPLLRTRTGSTTSHARPVSFYEAPTAPPIQDSQIPHQRPTMIHQARYSREDPYVTPNDGSMQPPPRPHTTMPGGQTFDIAYRGPPGRSGMDAKPRSASYRTDISAPVQAVPKASKIRSDTAVGTRKPSSRGRMDKKVKNAEDYMQERSQKSSKELTDDELEKRNLVTNPTRRTSKSQGSRPISQSAPSATESERQFRCSIDNEGAFSFTAAEGQQVGIVYSETGKVSTITVNGVQPRNYIGDSSATSRRSRNSFAERATTASEFSRTAVRNDRKRDSVVDADNARAVVRSDSDHSL